MFFKTEVLLFLVQNYKYRDLTIREITNVINQYKDLKPLFDNYGKLINYGIVDLSLNIAC